MKEKKLLEDWKAAAILFIIACFLFPTVINAVGIYASYYLFSLLFSPTIASYATIAFSLVIGVLSVWMGMIYGSGYMNNNFILKNSYKVIYLAMSYYIIFSVVGLLAKIANQKLENRGFDWLSLVFSLTAYIITSVAIYVFGKKYFVNKIINPLPFDIKKY